MELTPARLQAAAAALQAVLTFEHPADVVLRRFFREHPELGQNDRGFVADAVFAVLRHLRLLETIAGGRQPRRLLLAALALSRRTQPAPARAAAAQGRTCSGWRRRAP